MNMSAFIATRLSIVSSSVSPLLVDETPMLRLITSAESRLAAISNVVRVRVLFSKNRLNTVLPRSRGTFLTSRSAIDTKGTAVSRMRPITSGGRPSSVSRCWSSPAPLSCGLRTIGRSRGLDRKLELAVAATLQHDRQIARNGQARPDVAGLDRQLAASAIDQHGELDRLGPAVVEQLVDCGAHGSPGVEHVVHEHEPAAGNLERQLGRCELGAQSLLRVVVAIERDVDEPDRVLAV